jgi:hypothetical protein
MGNMDGVFVAYHNTARLFGFQYISLDEMDERLFGAAGRGGIVFNKCVSVLETVLSEIILPFPAQVRYRLLKYWSMLTSKQSLRCTLECLENTGMMNVWIEPEKWDEEQGEMPIAQLDVTATSYLAGEEVRGPRAISGAEDTCMLYLLEGTRKCLLMTRYIVRDNSLDSCQIGGKLRRNPARSQCSHVTTIPCIQSSHWCRSG